MRTVYALYTIDRKEERKEVLRAIASHEEMVELFPIFNDTINGNHIKSRRNIPQNFYAEMSRSGARKERRRAK